MKYKWLLLTFLFVATLLASCGGNDGLDTQTQQQVNDQDEDATTKTVDSNYQYHLPVIFHVFYKDQNDASQYVPASRLKSLLQYVNEIYKGGVYGESANTHLTFELAERDESGKILSTPGVEYINYTGDFPIDETTFMSSADNAKYVWDPNEYINVMLYPFKDFGNNMVLGLSHTPYTVKANHELEGLDVVDTKYVSKSQLRYPRCSSINSTFMGQRDGGGYYQSDRYTNVNHQATYLTTTDIAVTMAHELGHYLGLFHMFTERLDETTSADSYAPLDSCGDTDFCKDTPSYNRAEYNNYLDSYFASTPSTSYNLDYMLKRYACDATVFYSANIMDYAFSLGYKISPDQKDRIRHVLYYSPLIPGPKLNGANTRSGVTIEPSNKIYTSPRVFR